MSKTVDELIMVFEKARAEAAPFPQHHEDGLYAGIAAVVRALRDEFENEMGKCLDCSASGVHDHLDEVFNRILGDAGAEKVAGNQWTASTQPQLWAKTPATAPAPAVCEITAKRDRLKAALQAIEQGDYYGCVSEFALKALGGDA